MLLNILSLMLLLSGIFYILSVIVYKTIIVKMKDNLKSSDFVAFIALSLGLYIITAFLVGVFSLSLAEKIIMICFASSPFIIGKFATYQREKFYTILQILCIICSGLYVIW